MSVTKKAVRELGKMLGALVRIEWVDATAGMAEDNTTLDLAVSEAGGYLAHVDAEKTSLTIDKPEPREGFSTAGSPCFSVPTGWIKRVTRMADAESFTLRSSFSVSREKKSSSSRLRSR